MLIAARQAKEHFDQLVANGSLIRSAEICNALGVSRQAMNKAVTAHRLFFLQSSGIRFYPAFFADPSLNRRHLEKVCKALGNLSGSEKLQFFAYPKCSLRSRTPLEAIRHGDLHLVLVAAAGFESR